MSCRCVEKVDKAYAASKWPNIRVYTNLRDEVTVELFERTPKGDRPAKGHVLVATFCPFCGKRYRKVKP